MSDVRLCSCVKRKYTRELESKIAEGGFCKYCRNKLNPDQGADCYFFGPDTETANQEQSAGTSNQDTPSTVVHTEIADPETSSEQQEGSLAAPIRQEAHALNSQTTGTQLAGIDFFPLGDEEEASSLESGATTPGPNPGIDRIIVVEEPGRTPYPEEEPEHQVRQT